MRAVPILRRFAAREGGAMAVEFALLLPVIVLMFFSMVEITDAILAKRRLGMASSILVDLTTNRADYWLHEDEAENLMALTEEILTPYDLTDVTVRLTAVTLDKSSKKPVIVWSLKSTPGASVATATEAGYQPGDVFAQLDDRHYIATDQDIIEDGAHVIVGELFHPFVSQMTSVAVNSYQLTAQEVRRPRREDFLVYCTDAGCTDGDDWDADEAVPDAISVD